MKKTKKIKVPDLTEFTDDDGKKWVQTSADDLFSSKELFEIMESVEEDKETGDIVLARIDFQRVNKEYYEKVVTLEEKLKTQNKLLKKFLLNAKETIDKKNKKLKELIDYIKKLHLLLAYYNLNPENIDQINILPELLSESKVVEEKVEEKKIGYVEVEELVLNDKGDEGDPANK